jgi:hypothetical protein
MLGLVCCGDAAAEASDNVEVDASGIGVGDGGDTV